MPTRTAYRWVLTVVALACTGAGAEILLPLQGYCRSGRYMPVHVDGFQGQSLVAGSLPTEVGDGPAGVVPVLVGPSVNGLVVSGDHRSARVSLHELDDSERLVGVQNEHSANLAAALFPARRVLTVPLDPNDPLPGPPAAWQTLDGVLLESTAMAKLDESHRSALLGGGVTLAIASTVQPDDGWPWKRSGPLWQLRARPIGPGDSIANPDVFGPTTAVPPGLRSRDRRTFAAAAALLAAAMIAARHTRRPTIVICTLAVVAVAGAAQWRRSIPAVVRGEGSVVVRANDGLERCDTWLFEIGSAARTTRVPWTGFTRLHAASEIAVAESGAKLLADPRSASLQFEYRALPGRCIAFERSGVQLAITADDLPTRSPMEALVRDAYLQPGVTLICSRPNPTGWPDVVLRDGR